MFIIILLKEIFTILKFLLVIDILRFYFKYVTRQSPLPGPFPLPYIGNALQILYMNFKEGNYQFDLGEYARMQVEKYGHISEVYQGSTRVIYLSKAEYLEKVYVPNSNSNYFARPDINGVSEVSAVHGLFFNNDFKSWKRIRKFVSQSLMSPRFIREFTSTIQQLFEENEHDWKNNDEEVIFNISEWSKCFTTDMNMATLMGRQAFCLASLKLDESEWTNEMKDSRKVKKSVELFLKSIAFFTSFPKFLRHHFPIFNYYQNYFMNSLNFLKDFIHVRIMERREQIDRLQENEMIGSSLLDILLTTNTSRDMHGYRDDDSDQPLTDLEIRDKIVDLTIAGSDTSSNLFILAFWMIHIHPEVKVRLLEEIKSIFGNLLNRRITNEDLDNLKYLDAVIKETNRIQPIVPVSGRDLSTSSDTIAGYKFDSRVSFFINNLYIHRHEDYWREPNKFMPERFLNDKIVKNSYVPFGGGIRICPGKLSAMTQIKTLLILFLMKYNVELVDKETPLQRIYAGLNLYPCLMVRLSPKHEST